MQDLYKLKLPKKVDQGVERVWLTKKKKPNLIGVKNELYFFLF
jgi:hypothetical protein